MAQQYPIVWLPEEPGHVNIAKLAPHSPLCLVPNRRLWKTQDTVPGQARRVLAEYGLMGSSSWAVPAGTADPDQVSQVYPERNTWRTVAVSTALLTPGCKLEMGALFCPAGLTQWNNGSSWVSGGAFAELRARVKWRNGANEVGPHDFVLTMPGSGHGTWGGAENTLAGADWADLDERVVYDIMPPDYEIDPAVASTYSDGTTVWIELQVRGGERIVHASVYEVPSVHVQLHSTSGAQMVHGAPQGDPPTPRKPQTDAADGGGFQNHRHGTNRVLHAAERQGARLGPRIMNFAANSHSGSAWNTTIQTPIAIAGAVTLANLFDTTLTTYDTTHPGWVVAGSMAQLHRLNSSNYLRGRSCVIPVKVMLDASCPVQPATLRLQSSALEWIDIPIPAARTEVVVYGYLASQVFGDHFAGILQARVTVPAATTANIYNISVEYCEEDPMPVFTNIVVLAADVTNNNGTPNTIQDVTGLSFPVVAGGRYWFRFVINYTAAALTTGSRWSINGPTTSDLDFRSEYSLSTTTRTINEGLSAYNTPAASNTDSAATASNMAVVEGFLTATADGTVIARFASEVAGSAIVARAGSVVEYARVA